MRFVDSTRASMWFIWYVVNRSDSLYSLHNARRRHVYVVWRNSLGFLKPGFAVEGKPIVVLLIIAKTRKLGCDTEKKCFLTRLLLKNGIQWIQMRLLQFIMTTCSNFLSFCFNIRGDSPWKLVLATCLQCNSFFTTSSECNGDDIHCTSERSGKWQVVKISTESIGHSYRKFKRGEEIDSVGFKPTCRRCVPR